MLRTILLICTISILLVSCFKDDSKDAPVALSVAQMNNTTRLLSGWHITQVDTTIDSVWEVGLKVKFTGDGNVVYAEGVANYGYEASTQLVDDCHTCVGFNIIATYPTYGGYLKHNTTTNKVQQLYYRYATPAHPSGGVPFREETYSLYEP